MTDPTIIDRYQQFAEKTFGFQFTNVDLLLTAFTHRSYVNEHHSTAKVHNERLEFLGDAVLELAVTEFLYTKYEDPEGVLTSWRAALVRTVSRALLHRGDIHGRHRHRPWVLIGTAIQRRSSPSKPKVPTRIMAISGIS